MAACVKSYIDLDIAKEERKMNKEEKETKSLKIKA